VKEKKEKKERNFSSKI